MPISRKSSLYIVAAALGMLGALWTDAQVRSAPNGYIGSLLYGQAWTLAMFLILAGLGVLLIPKLRAVGLALVVLGGSLVSTVTTAAYLFPYMLDDPGLRPLVQGWVVRVHFREGTSTEQENLFLCQFVYSDCSSTGNSFPAEIISITRTGFSELTIATTTPEFQQRLLQEVRGASIVDRAAAEGFVGGN